MNTADMPFADSINFTVKVDEKQSCFPVNTLMNYAVITEGVIQVEVNNKQSLLRVISKGDILELLPSYASSSILRVEFSDPENSRMELVLLKYSSVTTLPNSLTIVVDDTALPQLHNIKISTQQEAVSKFRQWFLLKRNADKVYAFSIGRERLELVSRSYRIIIEESPQTHYLHVIDVQKRRNLPEGLIQLVIAPNIEFTDQRSVRADIIHQSEEIYRSLIKDNSELLGLWSAYNQCELQLLQQEAQEMGWLPYSDYHYEGNRITFSLEPGYLVTSDFIDPDTYYEAVTQSDFNKDTYLTNRVFGTVVVGTMPRWKDVGKASFSLERDEDVVSKQIPKKGVLYPSVLGSVIQGKRREQAQSMISSGQCSMPQLKLLLQSGQSIGVPPKHRSPITDKLEKTIFNGDTSRHFNDSQKMAINAALNTPDVAIIQGPPGTGKTQVIRAIIERINETEDGKARILITSTQHDAVDNASSGVFYNGVPVNRAGNKKKSEQDSLPIYDWIDQMTELCATWLKDNSNSDSFFQYMPIYEKLDLVETQGTSENLELFKQLLIDNEFPFAVISIVDKMIQEQDSASQGDDIGALLRHLDAQRTDKADYLNDGADNLKQFIRFLKFDYNHPEYVSPEWKTLSRITADTPELTGLLMSFSHDLDSIRLEIGGIDVIDESSSSVEELVEAVKSVIADRMQKNDNNGELFDLIWTFRHELTSTFNVRNLIRSYSQVNAATCQQSANRNISETMHGFSDSYDYVIVDEAARSNPLDLMIPMTMGKKIILVGDHKQLPHMLTADVVKKVVEENQGAPEVAELLKESLFVRLFNLMSADDKKQLRGDGCRVVMLNTQFRMHPDIGKLVGKLFYNDELHNGSTAEQKAPAINMYRDASLVWLDVPADIRHPHESSSKGRSRFRECEIDIIANQLTTMLSRNRHYSFGIISFYKEQTVRLQQMVDHYFPDQASRIQVGTVDAFQGKEFDIVILSTVRSNDKLEKQSRVGFLDDENRLCVAFSRAKRLLVTVGDAETVTVVESLKALFDECKEGCGYYERIS